MEFAYRVTGPPQWDRDIIIPPGVVLFMLISNVTRRVFRRTQNFYTTQSMENKCIVRSVLPAFTTTSFSGSFCG
jgi:hypothetical protein